MTIDGPIWWLIFFLYMLNVAVFLVFEVFITDMYDGDIPLPVKVGVAIMLLIPGSVVVMGFISGVGYFFGTVIVALFEFFFIGNKKR